MSTPRYARLEPDLTLRHGLPNNNRAPVRGLLLWAIAMLCIASLGQAAAAASDPSFNISLLAAGLF
jgi:hypothetical protein